MNNFLNTSNSLLPFSMTISTRSWNLKTCKNANQFNVSRNIMKTGPSNIEKTKSNILTIISKQDFTKRVNS